MLQENDLFKVRVSCMTFNHERFILDAMNSFVMQQTNFPFVCTIVDDASTDETPNIIRLFLEEHFDLTDNTIVRQEETTDYVLSYARHKTNHNCFFAVIYLKYNHYSIKKPKGTYYPEFLDTRYVAVNEGDDYWIDPLKLQKQIDFMEAHPEHSLCFCANQRVFPSGEIIVDKRYDSDVETCPMKDIILGGGDYMATNSMLYRQSMYVPYTTWAPNCPVGDLPLMLTLAQKGLVGYLADIMCAYRKGTEGSWTQRMASDNKRRHRHHKAILRMWNQFDKYSNYKYHSIIKKKKRNNKKAFYVGVMIALLSKVKNLFHVF